MKILTLDIEMMPNTVHVWDLRNVHYIAPNQVVEYAHFACAAYKFLGEPIQFAVSDRYEHAVVDREYGHVGDLWEAMDTADAIVTYNGKKFDIPRINAMFKQAGFNSPSPYHQIDLFQGIRKTFSWPSLKLDEVSKILLGDHKVEHEGHNLWVRCMAGDPEAWRLFREYCEKDVLLTEDLYLDVRGWLPNHPNVLLYDENPGQLSCPVCGGRIHRRGERQLATGIYERYQCTECFAWSKKVKRLDGATVRQ
jgi:DNA polymerase elongation subunit (family B)